MAIHQYSESARKRIAQAVRWTETRTRSQLEKRRRGRVVGVDKFVRAQQDIEHGRTGDVKHLAGPAIGQSVSLLTNDTAFKVYNPGPKVWAGSDLMIREFALAQSDQTNQAWWYIVQAWSATRIRGKAKGPATITPGTSGQIETVTSADGTFPAEPITVYLPTEHVSIEAGVVVWAELVYRSISGTSRWEVYSADCPEA